MPIIINNHTYNRGMTHPGTFHADEVFATALLRLIDPDFPVARQTAAEEPEDTLVFDQSRPSEQKHGQFDHHGTNAPVRADGTPYSSFGLLFLALSNQLFIDQKDAFGFEQQLVIPIDLQDNGVAWNITSQFIADIQNDLGSSDDAFWSAEKFAEDIIRRRISAMNNNRRSSLCVIEKLVENNYPQILVLDTWESGWQKAFDTDPRPLICVFPSTRGGWAAQAARVMTNSTKLRIAFPPSWRALDNEELQKISGVNDATFCHKDRFIATADSKEGAIKLAQLAIKHREQEKQASREANLRHHVILITSDEAITISKHATEDEAVNAAKQLKQQLQEENKQKTKHISCTIMVGEVRSKKHIKRMHHKGIENPEPYIKELELILPDNECDT